MIATINGTLTSKTGQTVIVETAGIGYALTMPSPDIAALPAAGSQVRLFTFMQAKEDTVTLYGFKTETEKELFVQLIGVSNIGPKAAINILSHLTPDQLTQAIVAGDSGLISAAPGVGKKTAQRLILELKEKLGAGSDLSSETQSSAIAEAREALIGLGYETHEAARALAGADAGKSADWYVKFALKRLAKV